MIPNGVDLEYFAYRPQPEAGRIVFSGNMSWPPNEDAAEHFAARSFAGDPKPDSRRDILDRRRRAVAASSKPGEHPGVHVTGTVEDIRPWIWSAAVYVSPLRFGLGVKNKILEAMAIGAPIVATSRESFGHAVDRRAARDDRG